MRRALLAALAAAWLLAACETTNITNVIVIGDAGDVSDAASAANGERDGGADAASESDAGVRVEAGVCVGAAPIGDASTYCVVADACSACGDGGFVYECADGARPKMPGCVQADARFCCKAQWLRSPEHDSQVCHREGIPDAFVGPYAGGGKPLLPVSPRSCMPTGPIGKTYVTCCVPGGSPSD